MNRARANTNNNFPNSEYSQSSLLLLEVFIVTIILLIFGEILPKTFAIVKSDKLANLLAKILDIVIKLIYPITFVFLQMTKFIIKVLPLKKEEIFDFRMLVYNY